MTSAYVTIQPRDGLVIKYYPLSSTEVKNISNVLFININDITDKCI